MATSRLGWLRLLHWILFFFKLKASNANFNASRLVTRGAWITDADTGQRVKLKCVNWYGAHQERHMVGGLELRGAQDLVALLASTGANCVRITLSIELTKYNPYLAHYPQTRALHAMDQVVAYLNAHQIMVIMNNHVSWAAWVGGMDHSQQGLWHLPAHNYTASDWIDSLRSIAQRYRGKIIGIDLRNEIHDQDGVEIDWGQTQSIESDWLTAATLASDAIHDEDPELLIFVGGLCWNFDLRAMMRNIGPAKVHARRKLVYAVHAYTFSFVWRSDEIQLWLFEVKAISFWFFAFSIALYWIWMGGSLPKPQDFLWLSLVIFPVLLAGLTILSDQVRAAKCACLNLDHYLGTVAAGTLVTAASWIYLVKDRRAFWLLGGMASLYVYGFAKFMLSEMAMQAFLGLWVLQDRQVPVWVAEVGTGDPDFYDWQWLWHYIRRKHDLDFAYWAFNGRKWDGKWKDEPFGLATQDYTKLRKPCFTETLFA